MSMGPAVHVIDDDASMREALRCLLESVHLRTETYESCEEFLDLYDPAVHGCVVSDVRMPGMSGLELLEKLVAEGDRVPVVLITGYGDISMAVRAMEEGASAFITKPFNDQHLLDRVRRALTQDAGRRRCQAKAAAIQERFAALTPREQEVMRLVIAGRANKVIAAELGVSCKTVEGHRSRVMEKMQADNLPDLVRMGLVVEFVGDNPDCRLGKSPYMPVLAQSIS